MTTPMDSQNIIQRVLKITYTMIMHIYIYFTEMPEEIEKLEYIYQHFQDHEKVYEFNPQIVTESIMILYTLS